MRGVSLSAYSNVHSPASHVDLTCKNRQMQVHLMMDARKAITTLLIPGSLSMSMYKYECL